MEYTLGFAYLLANSIGLFCGVLFLFFSLWKCKNGDYKKKVLPIKVLFFWLVIMEFIKIFYLIGTNSSWNPKSYPIIYCSSSMYFYFIIAFCKPNKLIVRIAKGAVIIPFFVMGILYFVSFPTIHQVITLSDVFLHIHSRLYHILMLFAAIYLIVSKLYDFRFKDFLPVSLFSAFYFQFCTLLSIAIGGEISNFGPKSIEIGWFYEKVGYATGNLLLSIIAVLLGFLVYGGIHIIRNRINMKSRYTNDTL